MIVILIIIIISFTGYAWIYIKNSKSIATFFNTELREKVEVKLPKYAQEKYKRLILYWSCFYDVILFVQKYSMRSLIVFSIYNTLSLN